jgi:hypothetical protein
MSVHEQHRRRDHGFCGSRIGGSGAGSTRAFGERRVCLVESCTTHLSRYNPTQFCSIHNNNRPLERYPKAKKLSEEQPDGQD